MNRAIFRRLTWKEYRLQRAFWIAMAVLALMLMLLFRQFNNSVEERNLWFFSIAFATPVFYILGCASTTFAGEHDAGTYEFQRSLPVSAMQVFCGKIVLVLLSAVALFTLLSAFALCLSGGRLPIEKHFMIRETKFWDILLLACMGAWLYLVWGVFFSLVLKRPLLAAIVSVTVASTGPYVIGGIMQVSFPSRSFLPMYVFVVLGVLVAIVDIFLGHGWLKDETRPKFGVKIPAINAVIKAKNKSKTLGEYMSGSNFWSALRRLTWQHCRQSAWVAIVALLMSAPLIIALIQYWLINKYQPSNIHRYNGWFDFCFGISIPLALAMPPLVGSFTFLGDQRQRSLRFFAERGIGSRTVWFSRLLPLLIVIVPFCLVFVLACIFNGLSLDYAKIFRRQYYLLEISASALFLFGYPILGLCVGQFCSMFFRSGILAGLFSLVITAFLMVWGIYIWACGISLLWAVLPLPAMLLLSTWVRAPHWILERNTFGSWLRPGLVLAVPAIVLLTVVPLNRVYRIPAVDPGFSVSEFERPLTTEEEATYRLFENAHATIDSTLWMEINEEKQEADKKKAEEQGNLPVGVYNTADNELSAKQIEFVRNNKEAISILIEAGKGTDRIASGRDPEQRYFGSFRKLFDLIIYSAMLLENEGHLDAALDRYLLAVRVSKQFSSTNNWYGYAGQEERVYERLPIWANRKGQTPERIKKAIRQIENISADMPAGEDRIEYNYASTMKSIQEGMTSMSIPPRPPLIDWFPWERARMMRLLNLTTHQKLDDIRLTVEDMKAGRPVDNILDNLDRKYPYFSKNSRIHMYLTVDLFWNEDVARGYAAAENYRRAIRIVLALQAWKLEHGASPKSLDELVGPYFEKLPNDPFSGEAYCYFPEGIKDWMGGPGMNFELSSPGNGKPVVWSTDIRIKLKLRSGDDLMHKYLIYDPQVYNYNGVYWREPHSLYDVLSHGRCFPMP
jgi:hypothetical protein